MVSNAGRMTKPAGGAWCADSRAGQLHESTQKQLDQRAAFGAIVREIRRAAGLSQEEPTHRVGLDRSYVGSVGRSERNVTLDNIHKLTGALQSHFFRTEN